MNLGRGWNPNLEESYLLAYSESEAETWKQGTSGLYIQLVIVLVPNTSTIPIYSEFTKTYHF